MTHEIECLLFERWIDKFFSNLQRFRRLNKEMDKILYNLLQERGEGQHFRSSEATSCKLTDLYKILKIHSGSKCFPRVACLWSKMPTFQKAGIREEGLPLSPTFQYLILMTWTAWWFSSVRFKYKPGYRSCGLFINRPPWSNILSPSVLRKMRHFHSHYENIEKHFGTFLNAHYSQAALDI